MEYTVTHKHVDSGTAIQLTLQYTVKSQRDHSLM